MDEELRAELLRRVAADQAARHRAGHRATEAADVANLPWLRQVLTDVGWPGNPWSARTARRPRGCSPSTPTVTRRSSAGAWTFLTAAAARGEATAAQQAYLTDRVLLHEGQPQEYGTQAIARNGRFEARKLRDPDHVDERRASVGLGPLAGYLARMADRIAPRSRCGYRAGPARRLSSSGRLTWMSPAP